LTGIAPAPRGVPKIEVTFDLDANGILNVSAEDKGSGKRSKITITNDSGRLSAEQIQKMVQDAERYKSEDEAATKRIQVKNHLESYVYSLRNSINDNKIGDKMESGDKAKLETAIQNTIKWMEKNDTADIATFEAKQKELEMLANPIMSKLYQSGGGDGGMSGMGSEDGYDSGRSGRSASGSSGSSSASKGPTVEAVD